MLLWLEFFLCTAVIVYSGTRLSKYGDIIAEKTGMGGTWIGLVLMASVTSLPELATGVSSVTYAMAPDIAVGNVLGACVVNMLILGLLDTMHRPEPLSTRAHHGHVLSAGFAVLMTSIVGVNLFLTEEVGSLGWIGWYSPVLAAIYFIAMRLLYTFEKRRIAAFIKERAEELKEELKYGDMPARTVYLRYALHAVAVIAAGLFLPGLGGRIAEATGLGQTFVGSIFIAVSTTLPELSVSVAAVRMGSVDLAIGNLFGSNIFNIFILVVDDLLFLDGPLLAAADPHHLITATSAVAMMSVAIIGLTYRAEKKRLLLAWDAAGIVLLYGMNAALLLLLR